MTKVGVGGVGHVLYWGLGVWRGWQPRLKAHYHDRVHLYTFSNIIKCYSWHGGGQNWSTSQLL